MMRSAIKACITVGEQRIAPRFPDMQQCLTEEGDCARLPSFSAVHELSGLSDTGAESAGA